MNTRVATWLRKNHITKTPSAWALDELSSQIQSLLLPTCESVIGGDFNKDNWSALDHQDSKYHTLITTLQHANIAFNEEEHTLHKRNPRTVRTTMSNPSWIDHFLVRGAFRLNSYYSDSTLTTSDHRPFHIRQLRSWCPANELLDRYLSCLTSIQTLLHDDRITRNKITMAQDRLTFLLTQLQQK